MRKWLPRFRRQSEEEFVAEVDAHLAHETDEQIERGLPPEDARYVALRRFGNVTRHLERFREASPWFWLETVFQDLRYAARGLRRTPWFTATAIVSLALGIGLNTATFTAIEAELLRPLPYKEPARIVRIDQTFDTAADGVCPGVFDQWQQRATSFESLGVYDWFHDAVLRDGAFAERVDVTRMSSGVLAVLGVPPLVGRTLRPEDDRPGVRVALLAHDFWMRRWNGDRGVLGTDLLIDDDSYRVVGIMPAGFRFYHPAWPTQRTWSDLYLSDPWAFTARSARREGSLGAIGRLKDGVTVEKAASEVATLAATTDYGVPPSADWGTPKLGGTVAPWLVTKQDAPSPFRLVWGIAAVVLLLAATNTASLLIARAGARRRELAIRAAIGASRARLVRQLLTESVLLSLMGGIAGLTMAIWAATLIETFMDTRQMVRLHEASLNWRVLGFMTTVALLTGVIFGVAPALRGSRTDQRTMLLPSGRLTDTRAALRTRAALLVTQLALSLVLLAGAGLMVTTLSRLWARPLGFNADNLITFVVRLPFGAPYITDLGLRPVLTENPSPGASFPVARRWAPTARLLALPQRLVETGCAPSQA